MSGFKFFSRNTATELINKGIELDGWFFSTEILVKALWCGHMVKEIPIVWTDDNISKVKVIQLTKEYLIEILRLRKERKTFIRNLYQ